MDTCFLFAESFDDENCLSLRLDGQGQVKEPLLRRTVDEFRSIQTNAKTIVVLPTSLSSLHELELSWLSERKARAVIPYALEEQLAQPVTLLQVAFDRQYYQHDRYLVVIIEKQIIMDLMTRLTQLQLNFDVITLDWFALNLGEACVVENNVIIHDVTFKGALSVDLLDNYLTTQTTFSHVLTFNDNIPLPHADQFTPIDELSKHWIAKRLIMQNPMNLCQGEFQHNTNQQQTKRWYQFAALTAGVWFLSVLLMNGVLLFGLKHQLTDYKGKIASVYHEFFPQARQVISPRFRIEQLLKQNQSGTDAIMWALLEKLTQAVFPKGVKFTGSNNDGMTIQTLRFQNKVLSVTLWCSDFAALEQLETRLHHEHVTVRQTNAAKHDNKVMATLELT